MRLQRLPFICLTLIASLVLLLDTSAVGKPRDAGGTRFVPEPRILAIEFPRAPTEKREKSRVQDLYDMETVSYFVRTDDRVTYLLVQVEVPSDVRAMFDPVDFLGEAAEGAAKSFRLPKGSVKPSTYAGLRSMRLTGVNSVGMRVEQQMFVLGRFQVAVAVIWPDGEERPRGSDNFFESFKILDKGAWNLAPHAAQSKWRRHKPNGGGFSVDAPGEPAVTSLGTGSAAGVGMVTTDGLGNIYRIIELPRMQTSDCGVDKVVNDIMGIEDQVREPARFAGRDGMVVRGRLGSMLADARVMCTEQRLFCAVVTSPSRRPGHADPERFFGSFTVLQGRKK